MEQQRKEIFTYSNLEGTMGARVADVTLTHNYKKDRKFKSIQKCAEFLKTNLKSLKFAADQEARIKGYKVTIRKFNGGDTNKLATHNTCQTCEARIPKKDTWCASCYYLETTGKQRIPTFEYMGVHDGDPKAL